MHLARAVKETLATAVGLLYPPCCAACGIRLPMRKHLCEACCAQAIAIEVPFCQTCSQPFHGVISDGFTCLTCADRKLYFSRAVSTQRNLGVVRDLIHRFKYSRQPHIKHALTPWLHASLQASRLAPFDLIVPVPLHPVRQRSRGYNQAARLAEVAAKFTGRPTENLLCRIRNTNTQTRLDRYKRMENLRGAFALQRERSLAKRHILLIDDVFTTGSTANECAQVLHKAGAASIQVVTVARS